MSAKNMVDTAAKKVSEEPMENMDDQEVPDYWGEEVPQHVRDEAKVEEAIERRYNQRQMDMYNDEMWNWSGLR